MTRVDRRTAELALDWCRRKWGRSRWVKAWPRLRVLTRSRQELYGWYNERLNLITLRLDWHESPLDLVETVIHEYCHYGFHYFTTAHLLSFFYALLLVLEGFVHS